LADSLIPFFAATGESNHQVFGNRQSAAAGCNPISKKLLDWDLIDLKILLGKSVREGQSNS